MKVPFTHRQPVIYDGMEGWLNFISTSYVTICVREWERSKEEQEGARNPMRQVNIVVTPDYWHTITPLDK